MEKRLKLSKIKPYCHSGGVLIETMLVLMIVGILSSLSIPLHGWKMIDYSYHVRVIEYEIINAQLTAIACHKKVSLPFKIDGKDLHYNHKGNINQAKAGTINRGYHSINIVFFLGFGRYEIR